MTRYEIARLQSQKRIWDSYPKPLRIRLIAEHYLAHVAVSQIIHKLTTYEPSEETDELLSRLADDIAESYAGLFGEIAPWKRVEGEQNDHPEDR